MLAGPALADEPNVRASMLCERASEPGRVRCSIEANVDSGRNIAWGDVAIVALPDFAAALKGRLGRDDATIRERNAYKWAFGLVAKRAGQGEARAKVRLVLCDSAREGSAPTGCAPVTVEVKATITVGG